MANAANLSRDARRELWYSKRIKLGLPKYSLGEEIFSAIVHGLSALMAITALILLLVYCNKDWVTVTSVAIFGGSMILLYTISTLYHALNINRAKKVFQTLDHCAIFLLIAGTYTPITSLALGGTLGLVFLIVVWVVAILGIVLNSIDLKKFSIFSMICYLAMGWVIVFVIGRFIENTNFLSVLFLILGGVAYTLGAVLYGLGKKVAYMHSIWHIFVLIGSIMHTLTVVQLAVYL